MQWAAPFLGLGARVIAHAGNTAGQAGPSAPEGAPEPSKRQSSSGQEPATCKEQIPCSGARSGEEPQQTQLSQQRNPTPPQILVKPEHPETSVRPQGPLATAPCQNIAARLVKEDHKPVEPAGLPATPADTSSAGQPGPSPEVPDSSNLGLMSNITITKEQVLSLFGELPKHPKPLKLRVMLDGKPQFSDASAKLYAQNLDTMRIVITKDVRDSILALLPPGPTGRALAIRRGSKNYSYSWAVEDATAPVPVLLMKLELFSDGTNGTGSAITAAEAEARPSVPPGSVDAQQAPKMTRGKVARKQRQGSPSAVQPDVDMQELSDLESESSRSSSDGDDSNDDTFVAQDAVVPGLPSAATPKGTKLRWRLKESAHFSISATNVAQALGNVPTTPLDLRLRVSVNGRTIHEDTEAKLRKRDGNSFHLRVHSNIHQSIMSYVPKVPGKVTRLQRSHCRGFDLKWSGQDTSAACPRLLLDLLPSNTVAMPPGGETTPVLPAGDGTAAPIAGSPAAADVGATATNVCNTAGSTDAGPRGVEVARAIVPAADGSDAAGGSAVPTIGSQQPSGQAGPTESSTGSKKRRRLAEESQQQKVRLSAPLPGLPFISADQHDTPSAAGPSTGDYTCSEEQEIEFQRHVLSHLCAQEGCAGATMKDVAKYWCRTDIRPRPTGKNVDRYYHVRAPGSPAVVQLRSYVEVAKFIADHMRGAGPSAPSMPTLPAQAQGTNPDQQQSQALRLTGSAAEEVPEQAVQAAGTGSAREEVLQHLCQVLDAVASRAASAPELASEVQWLQATAIAVAMGHQALDNPAIRQLLMDLPSLLTASGPGSSSSGKSLSEMLPLVAGSVSALPEERVRQAAEQLGLDADDQEVHVQLLTRAARAAAEMAVGPAGPPGSSGAGAAGLQAQRQVGLPELGYLQVQAKQLREVFPLDLLRNPMHVLLPAYKQVWQQGPLLCILAECLGHAQAGRVSAEQGFQDKITGELMRLFGLAAAGGATAWDSLRTAAKLTLQSVQNGGGAGGLAPPETIPDAVVYVLLDPEVQEEKDAILARRPQLQQAELDEVCVTAGYALYSQSVGNLTQGLVGVLQLVYGEGAQGVGMDVQLAVAAVSAGYSTGAGAEGRSSLFVRLLKGVQAVADSLPALAS